MNESFVTQVARNEMTELWDWRRQVADLYAGIRANPDPEAAWRQWRSQRDILFMDHAQSPLDSTVLRSFEGVDYFAYDPALRLHPRLTPISGAALEQFPAGAETITLRPFARTDGLQEKLGGELTLYWITGYGGGVFLPFADATNGTETFAAGRYLLDSIKGADLGMEGDRVVLDFNFSYFPSCAYSPRWVCPLAPPANRLKVAIRGGERG